MLFYEKLEVSVAKLNKANLKKTLYYLQRNGLRETWISVRERIQTSLTADFIKSLLMVPCMAGPPFIHYL